MLLYITFQRPEHIVVWRHVVSSLKIKNEKDLMHFLTQFTELQKAYSQMSLQKLVLYFADHEFFFLTGTQSMTGILVAY